MRLGGRAVAPIERVGLGRRLLSWLGGEWGHEDSARTPGWEPDPATTRVVVLLQERADGSWSRAELLRPLVWLSARGVGTVGDRTDLDLAEMGCAGEFRVVAIDPCPEIEAGPGRLVTGRFTHSSGRVYNVRVGDEPAALRVTAAHPFWSADRAAWVAVGELAVGERLLGEGGAVPVLGVEEGSDEPVFNLEVDADHCYRVGEQGILVHNASDGWSNCDVCHKREKRTYNSITAITSTETGAAKGGSFTAITEVAIDDAGKTIRYKDIGGPGSDTLADFAVVCRVLEVSGVLRKTPNPAGANPTLPVVQETERGPATKALNHLLIQDANNPAIKNPDPAISTDTYNAGHLIAVSLGGPDDIRTIIPLQKKQNIGAWGSMERWIAACLDRPEVRSATMHVYVTYGAPPRERAFIPSEFKVLIEFTLANGTTALHEFAFLNRQETQAIGGRGFAGQDCATTTQNPPPPLRR